MALRDRTRPQSQPFARPPLIEPTVSSVEYQEKSTVSPTGYPRTPEDISRVARYIQKATSSNMPAELLKPILFYAGYDCIHFSAHSDTTMTRRSRGRETHNGQSYIETEPLKYISPTSTDVSDSARSGRIRAVHLEVVGRDQGWGGYGCGSWSWFDIVRRRRRSRAEPENSMKLAHNVVASKEWQHHEMNSESNEELRTWASALRNGDRVGLVPMARYPGWSCSASSGSIDVEVEVWR